MSDSSQNTFNANSVIAMVAFVFIWPVFWGGVLFLLTWPFAFIAKRYNKSAHFWIGLLTVLVLSLSLIYWFDLYYLDPAGISPMAKNIVFDLLSKHISLSDRFLVKLTKYIVYTTPLSPFVAFVVLPFLFKKKGMDRVTTKDKKRDLKIPARHFKKSREKADGLLIGINKQKKPVYLTEKEMGMHTQVIGSTGFGKSASVLLPQLDWALKNGTGMVFIDGKGDLDSYSQFLSVVRKHGRANDVLMFSPIHTRISDKWNPLVRGTSVEIKDRLIGSQIWSEEFYKKKGEDLMLLLLNVFEDLNICPSFKKLERVMVDPNDDLIDVRNISDPDTKKRFLRFKENYKKDSKNFEGIASDLSLFINTHFGNLFECEKGEGIDFLEAYFKNKIIYCHLPVLVSEESIKRIGRMLIHDLKTMVGYVQNFVPEWKRNFFPVFIDEFASFASENFIELLNKARSSKVAFTIIHQSMGDIQKVSDNFAKQLFENTNIKIVLRIDDPDTIEKYAKMAGTRQTLKYTYQTESNIFGRKESGGASMREVDEFLVDPNEFRHLRIGQAVVIVKSTRQIDTVFLDYLNPESIQETLSILARAGQSKSRINGKSKKGDLIDPSVIRKVTNQAGSQFCETVN